MKPLIPLEEVSTVSSDLDHPEGLAFDREGILYCGGEAGQIYQIRNQQTRQICTTNGFILGMAFSASNSLFACDMKLRAVFRIESNGTFTNFCTTLRNPNFPAFDREGNLYVTDSGTFGKDDGTLVKCSPTGEAQVILGKLNFPNGLAFSSDRKVLFLVESTKNRILSIPIQNDRAGKPGIYAENTGLTPDGIALDVEGNLYVSCYSSNQIWRIRSNRGLELLVDDPVAVKINRPTNLAFGGPKRDELFIANLGGWHIAKIQIGISGDPLL